MGRFQAQSVQRVIEVARRGGERASAVKIAG